jgi:hypothetical protein
MPVIPVHVRANGLGQHSHLPISIVLIRVWVLDKLSDTVYALTEDSISVNAVCRYAAEANWYDAHTQDTGASDYPNIIQVHNWY